MEGNYAIEAAPVATAPLPAEIVPKRPIELLAPGTDLHATVLEHLMARLRYSERMMAKFYGRWNVNERKLQAYVTLPKYEEILKAMTRSGQPPELVSIVVPYTYATVWTIVTYLIHTFCGQKPLFQIGANSAESVKPAANMETVLQYNADHTRLVARMFQWFLDDAVYGVGAVRTLWVEEKRTRTKWQQGSPGGLMLPGASRMMKTRQPQVVYEGNEVVNIDPFMFFPDPRVPMNQVNKKGEFVFWRSFESHLNLKRAENDGQLMWVDSIGEVPRQGTEGGPQGGNSVRSLISEGDPHPGDPLTRDSKIIAFKQIDQGTVLINPKTLGLSDDDEPQYWLFTIGNKNQILQAEPFDYDHGQHPVSVIESNTFGYGFGQPGTVDMLGPIQDSLSWFMNSHIYNVRTALNNMWIVDPSMVEMQDLKTPGPGKVIRLKRAAYGQDVRQIIQQLQVQDVTATHVNDMQLFMRIGDSLSAVNDNLRGIQNAGGRKTATEVRTSGEAGASRLAAKARYISAQGMVDLAEQMSLNCQQFMSLPFYVQVVGLDGVGDSFTIQPPEVAGDFHYPISDGTLPIDKTALIDIWKEIWLAIQQDPTGQMQQIYDGMGVFEYLAQLGGAKNLSQFKRSPGQVQAQVMPDDQVNNGVQNGNLVNAGQGPLPIRGPGNRAGP